MQVDPDLLDLPLSPDPSDDGTIKCPEDAAATAVSTPLDVDVAPPGAWEDAPSPATTSPVKRKR